MIGEGTLFGGNARSATFTATGDVQALFVDQRSMQQILDRGADDFRYYLLGLVQHRGSARTSTPVSTAVPTAGRMPTPPMATGIQLLANPMFIKPL